MPKIRIATRVAARPLDEEMAVLFIKLSTLKVG
jgi:hypothetical protein